MSQPDSPARRTFLKAASVGSLAISAGRAEAFGGDPSGLGEGDATRPDTPLPTWLAPLEAGSDLGLGWILGRGYAPAEGAVTLTLVHREGRVARVDVCLRSGPARGPASTELLDLLVMDGGSGGSATDESLARALRRVAATIAAHEPTLDLAALAPLRTHDERLGAFPLALAAAPHRLAPGA